MIISCFFPCSVQANNETLRSQANSLGIPSFLKQAKIYTKDSFPELDLNSVFESGIQGKLNIAGLTGFVIELLGEELKSGIAGMVAILIVVIIHSILKAVIDNLSNSNAGRIAYFVEYLAIVSMITTNFSDILLVTKNAINELINFMRLFVPILITLMFASGGLASGSGLGAIIIGFMNLIGTMLQSIIIPILMCSTVLGIVNSFTDQTRVAGLSKFMKTAILWMLGIILTLFVCSLTLQGTLSQSVDGVTSKTAKVALSSFIPFVGKIMGDTLDTVIGCTNILKNTFGVIGVIVLLGIAVLPVIKVVVMWFLFRLVACVCETIADSKIVKLLAEISNSYLILLGVLISCSMMFIIGITITLRMTNIVG